MSELFEDPKKEKALLWWNSITKEQRSLYAKIENRLIECWEIFENPDCINGFFFEYRFLSNYHICPVVYDGLKYMSSEAAYQSAKTESTLKRSEFTRMRPNVSKREGFNLRLRDGWDKMKIQVMKEVLLDKFTRNKDLKELLLLTGDKYLEETNWWGDIFWGVSGGKGENNLGKILMELRTTLRNENTSK